MLGTVKVQALAPLPVRRACDDNRETQTFARSVEILAHPRSDDLRAWISQINATLDAIDDAVIVLARTSVRIVRRFRPAPSRSASHAHRPASRPEPGRP
jgi:hypothetical protein